jgi:hypothetical protein
LPSGAWHYSLIETTHQEKHMKTMNSNEVNEILAPLRKSGKMFSVTFIKKDDTERTFSGVRFGVKKHLRGGVSTIAGKADLVGVWGKDESYKCFSNERVLSIRASGSEKAAE